MECTSVLNIGARALVHLKFITFNPVSEGWENPKITPFKENFVLFCHYFSETKMDAKNEKMTAEGYEAAVEAAEEYVQNATRKAQEERYKMIEVASVKRLRDMPRDIKEAMAVDDEQREVGIEDLIDEVDTILDTRSDCARYVRLDGGQIDSSGDGTFKDALKAINDNLEAVEGVVGDDAREMRRGLLEKHESNAKKIRTD